MSEKKCGCALKAYGALVTPEEVKRFTRDCMIAAGASEENATILANSLAEAEIRGHGSYGLRRLESYVKDVKNGTVDGTASPEIRNETPATAWVDGKKALGVVVGSYCVSLGMKKAEEVGIGLVVANNSSDYGTGAFYSMQAANEGYIAFTCSNGSPAVCPFGSKNAVLGFNRLSVAAKGKEKDKFVLDMTTAAASKDKIEVKYRHAKELSNGWCIDTNGYPMKDAREALSSCLLLPLGADIGYKGTGLALMVEIFCGVLGGANFSSKVPASGNSEEGPNLGQFFILINPKCFAPEFEERLSELLASVRNLTPINKGNPVMVSGDPETTNMEKVEKEGGIRYTAQQIDAFQKLATELGVEPLQMQIRQSKD